MQSGRPSAVLFDVDGTLIDDAYSVAAALRSFHTRYRDALGLSLEDLRLRWRELLNLHFARYLAGEISMQEQRRARILDLFRSTKLNLTSAGADAVFAFYEQRYRESWTAFPDAMPALSALNGYVLAVLTNGDLAQQTQKLQATGLASYFRSIFASSEMGCSKPHPEAFVASCSRLGVDPRCCVYVGDSLDLDVRASASAGLISIWIDRGQSGSASEVGSPVIHSLVELPALISGQTAPSR